MANYDYASKNPEWFNLACTKDKEDQSGQIACISEWYDAHETVINAPTRMQWDILSMVSKQQANRMKQLYNVKTYIVSGQPYESETAMFEDIARGILYVSRDNVDHPLMTLEQTLDGRIWHDLTHYEIRSNFGFTGETETYHRQVEHTREYAPSITDTIEHTLYLDIVCQVASGMTYKCFPVQKVF